MGTTRKVLISIALGIVLGLGATYLTIVRGVGMGGGVTNGPWRTSLLTGSYQSGLTLRAAVALHGLFALSRREAIYYTAVTDSDGNALDGACRYSIAGRDPPVSGGLPSRSAQQPARLRPSGYAAAASAREGWWSITAYGRDDFLIPNANGHYSISKNSVTRDRSGAFHASLSARTSDDITVAPGAFSLTLRLYNPEPDVAADPAHVALPAIHREACP
jgi:hypothetical protein